MEVWKSEEEESKKREEKMRNEKVHHLDNDLVAGFRYVDESKWRKEDLARRLGRKKRRRREQEDRMKKMEESGASRIIMVI